MARDEVFRWDTNCNMCGRVLAPLAHGNLSASVIFRIYVCQQDAVVIVRRSDGVTKTFRGDYLATMFDKAQEGGGDGA